MKKLLQILILLTAVLVSASPSHAIHAFGARHPALSPDGALLAFDWRGDIWVVPVAGGEARALTDHVAHDANPRWSPDGKEIAFSSDRHGNLDIFVVDLEGGAPERLTFHSHSDRLYDWSPDGRTIYFGSWRGGRERLVHAVPRSGGRPVRVTGDRGFNAAISPDGKWLAYVRGYTNWWRRHYRGPANREIWVRALSGGESFRITQWEGDDDQPRWSADGRALFFQSERQDAVRNLYRQELRFDADRVEPAGAPEKLTNMVADGVWYLDVSRNGELAAFESMGNLFIVSTEGGEPRQIAIDCPGDSKENEQTRRFVDGDATEFAFAPGEKEVAFIVEGEVYAAFIKDDELMEPMRLTKTDAREKDLAWLDEHTLLYVSDRNGNDDIYVVRSTDEEEPRLSKSRYREEARLTDHPDTEFEPHVSPDGETILYKRGVRFMWTMRPDGSEQKLLLDMPGILHSDWSPDSRYVAYSITTLAYAEDIYIYEVEGDGEPVNVSNHPNDDFHPLWTDDGKRLSWASRTDDGFYSIKYLWLTREEADKSDAERQREEDEAEEAAAEEKGEKGEDGEDEEKEPVEVKIDWDDTPDRIRTVTTVRGYYWDYDASPDGKNYALRTDVLEEMELWTVDWEGDHLRRMTSGGADPDLILWNEDGDKVRYLSNGRIFEIANEEGADPVGLPFSVELTVNAAERRLQKFHEAWRRLNDGFYDENFHGIDWRAMRDKYEPLALAAVMTEDLNDVLRQMIGELNASHLGAWGPRGEGGDETGLLGFTIDDSYEGAGVRVAEVLPHGPLDREGKRVEPGEVIYAIDGAEIGSRENFFPLLNHKAGREVDLIVGGERRRDERKVTVEPIDGDRLWRLSYEHWIKERRGMVDRLSDDRLGYLHMEAMGDRDWDRFIEDVFSKARGKAGLILDVRFNNGGSIHDRVLTFLSRRPYILERGRGDRDSTYNAIWRWDGPIVMLTNEASYSDGEIFPMGFKQLGLGTIVGMPTFGAVIGTNDIELIDGTNFRIPGTGWYRMDGRNLENDPVMPDILVEDIPEENLRGRDVQLETAVEECLRMLGTRE